MEALECIKTRRSVRKFTEEPVTREQLADRRCGGLRAELEERRPCATTPS